MFTRYKRKYSNLFAKVTLLAFSFAWIACTSHISFVPHTVPTHTQASHSNNEESETHNTSCLDHTYQISTRNQGNVFPGDFDSFVIPAPVATFDFSVKTLSLNTVYIYESDQGGGENLFLKNTVLRL